MTTERHRLRGRFRKEGDLRWISHRDLARTVERWLRRAQVPLKMSEGFHPKPRISFPSALAVGIAGWREVLEVELTQPWSPAEFLERLEPLAPNGLTVNKAEPAEPRAAQAVRATYQIEIPNEDQEAARNAVRELMNQSELWIERSGAKAPIDLRAGLLDLELHSSGCLRYRVAAGRQGAVRPREVLEALRLGDIEQRGAVLIRADVEIEIPQRPAAGQ